MKPIIQPFFDNAAGPAWASQRRQRVAEEVRRLVLGGWGGWETIEAEREKEVVMMVEEEVDGEVEPERPTHKEVDDKDEDMDFGWDFDNDKKNQPSGSRSVDNGGEGMDVDDGGAWGFAEVSAQAGPSKPRQTPPAETHGDGWEFDDVAAQTPVKPVAAPKPAREAKRLGRKVAKVKTVPDEDVWGSEAESVTSEARQNGHVPDPPKAQMDNWGNWINDEGPKTEIHKEMTDGRAAVLAPKPRRKVLREKRRMMKETFMISRACEKLLETTERVLREAQDLRLTE